MRRVKLCVVSSHGYSKVRKPLKRTLAPRASAVLREKANNANNSFKIREIRISNKKLKLRLVKRPWNNHKFPRSCLKQNDADYCFRIVLLFLN